MPHPDPTTAPDGLRSAVSADGTRIAYRSVGSGPGLVVLSGATLAGDDYTALARHLSGSLTVHLVDRRGRGGSGPQGDGYGIEAECADLAAVLRATGARRVFGHSFGGLVALQAALREPGAVDRVVAYEPAVSVDGSLPRGFLAPLTDAVAAGRLARAMALLLRGLRLAGPLNDAPLPLATAASWLLLATVGRGMRTPLRATPKEVATGVALDSPAAAYADLAAATLVLTGADGPDYLGAAAAALAGATPAMRHTIVPGLDHSAPQQAPEKVAAEIRSFLDA